MCDASLGEETLRDHIAVSVIGGKIYVAGGRLGSFARNLPDNEEYDPTTDTWFKKAPLPREPSTPPNVTAPRKTPGKLCLPCPQLDTGLEQ